MPAPSSLRRLLTVRRIRSLASPLSFERGETYLAQGRVGSVVESNEALTAIVQGSEHYSVRLDARAGELTFRCSCPIGRDGRFCKHNVAVALAWLGARKDSSRANETPAAVVKLDDIRPWMMEQDKASLATWLMEAAARDEWLREKLLRQVARASRRGLDFQSFRRSIDRATPTRGFFDYRETRGLADRIRDAIEPLAELLTEGHAPAVIELCEHALGLIEKILGNADDSDGELSGCLADLQALHLRACEAARPDPEELAARLFEWETTGDWEVFYGAAETYAGVFGDKGLAVYRARAETAWKALPALKPGEQEDWSTQRFRITSIMESLARAVADVDALVAIKAKNLSHAYAFFQIAELYREAKRPDAALDWAERGLKAFPTQTDGRLIEFLADEYHRRRRHDEALALIWKQFSEQPSLKNYQLLKQHADRPQTWPEWRDRALATLRGTVEGAAKTPRNKFSRWFQSQDHSELVSVFLWENEIETAWREAQKGGCGSSLWLELAAARANSHPGDSAPIYAREAERLIERKDNRGYADAVCLLMKAKELYIRAENADAWTALIFRLRGTHKAKRNFISAAAKL
jgi:uncharacterized Zn finger protein